MRQHGAKVISISLGGAPSARFGAAPQADNLYRGGALSIAAAGNDGNSTTSYPAGYYSVVSVAAVDRNKQHAAFSQANKDVELSARGVSVWSTVP